MKKYMKKNNQIKIEIIVIMLLSLVYFIRVIYLDADIKAPWGVLNYQPIDEGCYGEMALNIFDFKTINPNDFYEGKYNYYVGPQVINNVFGNIFSFIPMLIFGDNFIGFRLGPIIAGYLILIFFYLTIKKISQKEICIIFFTLVLLTNFQFYNACRIVEPTIFRLLFIQIIIYVYMTDIKDNIKYYIMGLLAVLSIFGVYITNLFSLFPFFLLFVYLILNKKYKDAGFFLKWSLLGGITGYIISLIYYKSVWNTYPVINALNAFKTFQGVSTYGVNSVSILSKINSFLSSNLFLYMPILFLAPILLIVVFPSLSERRKKETLFIVGMAIGLFIQTLVSEDYVVRKSLVLITSLICLVCIVTENIEILNIKKHKYICMILFGILLIYISINNVMYRLYKIDNKTNLDFNGKDIPIVWTIAGCMVCIIVLCTLMFILKRNIQKVIYLGSVVICILNLMLIYKYNLHNMTFVDKKVATEVGEIVGENIVCLSYENNIRLYNDIKPLVCYEDEMYDYMKNDKNMFYYGYSGFETFNEDENSINQNVYIYKEFNREFMTFGEKRSWALYKFKKE